MKGVLNGLFQVHELDFIHRDIKFENIMVPQSNNFKSEDVNIVDFGFSARFKANPKMQIDDKIGTILFMSPEQISLKNYGKVLLLM